MLTKTRDEVLESPLLVPFLYIWGATHFFFCNASTTLYALGPSRLSHHVHWHDVYMFRTLLASRI